VASPFLYIPGAALSVAELSAARIDGHVVEVGDAYMPADAAETTALRAESIAGLVPDGYAVTHAAAAWIHGAITNLPARVAVQRTRPDRARPDHSLRLECRDSIVDPADLMEVAGVDVTTPTRTLADLARCLDKPSRAVARAMALGGVADPDAARRWIWTHARLPRTTSALRLLSRLNTR